MGALITRGLFIAVGAALLAAFHWVTYIFGVFLVLTAMRLLFGGSEEVHPEKNPVLRLFRRFIRTTPDYAGAHFFVREAGKLFATPLLTVLVVIEATDVVFAVDSIPAVFGVTRDVFIVYTSNIFAVLGLRALTFLVARLVRRLRYLKVGLALVLAFVGAKMLIADRYRIRTWCRWPSLAGSSASRRCCRWSSHHRRPTRPRTEGATAARPRLSRFVTSPERNIRGFKLGARAARRRDAPRPAADRPRASIRRAPSRWLATPSPNESR